MTTNPRRANGHRRDQLRRRVLAEESECGICGEPVDKTLPHGLPGSAEVDEIVPVSLGGDPFDRTNCRLVHRLCNQRRGNGTRKEAVPKYVRSFETTRNWWAGPPAS